MAAVSARFGPSPPSRATLVTHQGVGHCSSVPKPLPRVYRSLPAQDPPGRPCWRGGRLVVTLLRWSPSSEAPSKRRKWAPSSAAGGAASGRRRWTSASRCGGAGTWPPGRPLCALALRTAARRAFCCLPACHPANGCTLSGPGASGALRASTGTGRSDRRRHFHPLLPVAGQVPAGPEDRVGQLWRHLHRCVCGLIHLRCRCSEVSGTRSGRHRRPRVAPPPQTATPTAPCLQARTC